MIETGGHTAAQSAEDVSNEELLWSMAGESFTGMPGDELDASDPETRRQLFGRAAMAVTLARQLHDTDQRALTHHRRVIKALEAGKRPTAELPARLGDMDTGYDDQDVVIAAGRWLASMAGQLDPPVRQPEPAPSSDAPAVLPERLAVVRTDYEAKDDAELCALTRGGDMQAFSQLWSRNLPSLTAQVHNRLRETDRGVSAEDVLAHVGLQALEALKAGRYTQMSDKSFSAWLWGIGNHRIIDLYREAQRRPQVPFDYDVTRPQGSGGDAMTVVDRPAAERTEDIVLHRDLRLRLLRAIATLPEKQQGIAMEYLYLDKPAKEVGQTFNMSPGAVRVAAHRALEHLADHLRPAVEDSPETTITADTRQARAASRRPRFSEADLVMLERVADRWPGTSLRQAAAISAFALGRLTADQTGAVLGITAGNVVKHYSCLGGCREEAEIATLLVNRISDPIERRTFAGRLAGRLTSAEAAGILGCTTQKVTSRIYDLSSSLDHLRRQSA